jgi:protein-S-isoprenylcysteine O-methyltransferase Ste14
MGQIIFFVMIGLWILMDLTVVIFKKTEEDKYKIEKKSKYIIIVMILIGMLSGPFLVPGSKEVFVEPFTTIRYLSIFFLFLGITIRLIAIIQLGANFKGHVVIENEKELYQKGLYKVIRHPSYLGELLIFIGVSIAYYHPLASLIAVVVPTLAFIYRIDIEEKMLVSHFNHDYIEYQSRTKKLIPFIY